MRANPPIRASLILLLLLISRPLAAAEAIVDTIIVKDGSVLKGAIKRVENDKLVLGTDYANDVVIDIRQIVEIESKQHYSIRLISGEIISGYLAVSNGKISLREKLPAPDASEATEAPGEIDLAEPAPKIPPTTPDPGVDGLVREASPPAESPTVVTRVDGWEISFDDVDWIREKPSYLRYTAELNVGAQLARGNTDTTDLHFDGHFQPSFGWNTLRVSGHYDKKEADGDTTTNRWLISLEYERDIGRRWFIGAANSYERDRQRDLDLRLIVAAGLGYRFFDDDPTFLSVLPGLAYVDEMFTGSSGNQNFVAFDWKLHLSRDLYKNEITFYHDNRYLNNLQTLSDIILETKTGIEFDLGWNLKLSTEFQAYWENEPADDAKKWDTRYILKIGFDFEGDENDWFR